MPMSIPKRDLKFIFLTTAIFVVLLIVRIHKENLIDNNKVFVAAIIKDVEWLSNGFLYKCEYRYNDICYTATFSDIRPQKDSLVLLQISTIEPGVWMLVDSGRLP